MPAKAGRECARRHAKAAAKADQERTQWRTSNAVEVELEIFQT